MNLAFKTLAVFFGVIIFQSNILVGGTDQDQQPTSQFQRTKENFDQSWQFHKGDIALKRVIQAGGQGGLTDTNVKIISNRDTVIDYTSENSFKGFILLIGGRLTFRTVIENNFVNDNALPGNC